MKNQNLFSFLGGLTVGAIAALLLALALAVTATGCQGAPVPESSTPSTSTTEPSDTTEQTSAASTVGRTDEDGELDENQYLNVLLADEPTVLDVARFSMIQDRNVFYNVLEPLTRIEDGIVTSWCGELGRLR